MMASKASLFIIIYLFKESMYISVVLNADLSRPISDVTDYALNTSEHIFTMLFLQYFSSLYNVSSFAPLL